MLDMGQGFVVSLCKHLVFLGGGGMLESKCSVAGDSVDSRDQMGLNDIFSVSK